MAILGARNFPLARSSSWNRNITVAQLPFVSTARSISLRTRIAFVLVVVGQLFQSLGHGIGLLDLGEADDGGSIIGETDR